MLVISLIVLLTNFIMYSANVLTPMEFAFNMLMYLIPTFLFPGLTAIFVMFLEKRPIKPMLKVILCYPLFMGSWILINIKCLVKKETTWKKIEHVRDIKVSDVKVID